ncbi:MAG: ATP-binding cassette domain-containing protein [Actinomycetia bacterium]|nr:ATP-binding cassette domain-containing protein [Actinomycetes bacterium]
MSCENVSKAFGERPLLRDVSLGVGKGERIGVVGRNGAGKSTLLRVLAGTEPADSGRVTRGASVVVGELDQVGISEPDATIRSHVLGDRDEHEWASDSGVREILTALLGGFDSEQLDRNISDLSGGERRRAYLAEQLIREVDVLFLDEPTNHLDVEIIAWLAAHLKNRPKIAIVTVTHDRWFLDEVCDHMWEVVGGNVEEYEGGYSAYVLAKAERMRQDAVSEARRQNLMRKELAWLRRGPPARTTKPQFRIDAANELIAAEPPPRNAVELLEFASARLGRTVYELHDAKIGFETKTLINHITWNIAPGARIGILGPNGAGKTSVLRSVLGELPLLAGKRVEGVTVKTGVLSQNLADLDLTRTVIDTVSDVANYIELGKGKQLSASQVCQRLGFDHDGQFTRVGELSGGERRRLELTRILMSEPNVLVLDEPTNDFDVEILAALEDLLDGFPGTLIIISHDRYFLERVCDNFVAVMGDQAFTDLPGGIEQYLDSRRKMLASEAAKTGASHNLVSSKVSTLSPARERELRKATDKFERQLSKIEVQIGIVHDQMLEFSHDFERVAQCDVELRELNESKETIELQWIQAADELSEQGG